MDIDEQLLEELEWPTSDENTFIVSADMSLDIKPKLQRLLAKYNKSFAKSQDELGTCTVGEVHIDTGDHAPIFSPPYPVDDDKIPSLKKMINKMLELGVIRVSKQCAWGSPAVIATKKNGEARFCVNYKKLNDITKTMNFPLPLISDILRRLGQSCYFSLFDLKSGFWQIRMHPDSITKTACVVPWAIYEFIKLPFGLKNSPSEFTRIMFLILGDLSFVEIYIDDIIIHSRTIDEHFDHISAVLERMKNHNLRLNATTDRTDQERPEKYRAKRKKAQAKLLRQIHMVRTM